MQKSIGDLTTNANLHNLEVLPLNRIDLCIRGDCNLSSRAKALSISVVGCPFDGRLCEGVIYRLKNMPSSPVNYPYLTVSENVHESADLLMIKDFRKVKEALRRKVKQGTGLEVLIEPVRRMDAGSVGKWFDHLNELHTFCHSAHCQFILSSGAGSIYEMVSGRCLDAILKTAGIDPRSHWHNMEQWLQTRLSKRISYA